MTVDKRVLAFEFDPSQPRFGWFETDEVSETSVGHDDARPEMDQPMPPPVIASWPRVYPGL